VLHEPIVVLHMMFYTVVNHPTKIIKSVTAKGGAVAAAFCRRKNQSMLPSYLSAPHIIENGILIAEVQ